MWRNIIVGLGLTVSLGNMVDAAEITVLREIPGYECMMLNLTPDQMVDTSIEVPVYSQPSNTSQRVGNAAATVAAKTPLVVRAGFVQVLFPTGAPGWIAKSYLKTWHSMAAASTRCMPALMSTGRLGFAYRN